MDNIARNMGMVNFIDKATACSHAVTGGSGTRPGLVQAGISAPRLRRIIGDAVERGAAGHDGYMGLAFMLCLFLTLLGFSGGLAIGQEQPNNQQSRLPRGADDPTGTYIAPPPYVSNYQPVFIQNFAAMTSLSQARISPNNTTGKYIWIPNQGNPSYDYGPWAAPAGPYKPFNISNGYLTIRAQRNHAPTLNPWKGFGGFTTGFLESANFFQKYGYFVVCMKTPGGDNTWPAFWMAGRHSPSSKHTAEVDVTESYGAVNPEQANNTHEGWILWGPHQGALPSGGHWTKEPTMTSHYNTYAVDIEPTGLTWYFDNKEIWSQTARQLGPKEMAALNSRMSVMVNLGLHGDANEDGTPDPSDLKVRYVAVYASPYSPNYVYGATQPKGLRAKAISGHKISLSWSAPSGSVKGYNVYRGTVSGEQSAEPINAGLITTRHYVNAGVAQGTTFYYTVKGVSVGGVSSPASNQVVLSLPVKSSMPNSISVQFVGPGTPLRSRQLAGVSIIAQNHWNAIAGNSWNKNMLVNNTGHASGATLSGHASGTYHGGLIHDGIAADNSLTSGELFNWGTLTSAVHGGNVLTFSNIPYSHYDVYVTASIDKSGRGETIVLIPGGGSAMYRSFATESSSGASAPWVPATSHWNGVGTPPKLLIANYAEFTGLHAHTFKLTWGATPPNGAINGVEIVESK